MWPSSFTATSVARTAALTYLLKVTRCPIKAKKFRVLIRFARRRYAFLLTFLRFSQQLQVVTQTCTQAQQSGKETDVIGG